MLSKTLTQYYLTFSNIQSIPLNAVLLFTGSVPFFYVYFFCFFKALKNDLTNLRGGFRVQKIGGYQFCKIDIVYIKVITLIFVVIVVVIIIIANVAILFCFEILVVTA